MHHVHPVAQRILTTPFPIERKDADILRYLCEEECEPYMWERLSGIKEGFKFRTSQRIDRVDEAISTFLVYGSVGAYADGIHHGKEWALFKEIEDYMQNICANYRVTLELSMYILSDELLQFIARFRDDIEEVYYMLESMDKDD